MPSLKEIVESPKTPEGRLFALVVQALVLLSVASFSLQTLPDLPPKVHGFLHVVEIVTVILFTLGYLIRFAVADKKLHYVFSFFGLIDLFAILPFYLAMGVDLRALRAFRFLRLFRIFKLVRYSRALHRFHVAAKMMKEELLLFGSVAGILLYLSAVGIYFFEKDAQPEKFASIFHALWWAVCTMTTVGYGDVYPITVGGRVFTFFVLLLGLGIVAVPTGLFASALARARQEDPPPSDVAPDESEDASETN